MHPRAIGFLERLDPAPSVIGGNLAFPPGAVEPGLQDAQGPVGARTPAAGGLVVALSQFTKIRSLGVLFGAQARVGSSEIAEPFLYLSSGQAVTLNVA